MLIVYFSWQVALLKKRVKVVSDGALPPEGEVRQSEDPEDSASATQSPSKEGGAEPEASEGKNTVHFI